MTSIRPTVTVRAATAATTFSDRLVSGTAPAVHVVELRDAIRALE